MSCLKFIKQCQCINVFSFNTSKMWPAKVCCINLRVGVITIAIFEIATGLNSFGLVLFELYNLVGTSTLIGVLNIAGGSCVLYGVIKENSTAIFFGLIILPIVFCVILISLIIAFVVFAPVIGMYLDVTILAFVIYYPFVLLIMWYLLITILKIYSWLCIFSFYRQLKTNDHKFLMFLSGKI